MRDNQKEGVKLLLQCGAAADAKNKDGVSAIDVAQERALQEVRRSGGSAGRGPAVLAS